MSILLSNCVLLDLDPLRVEPGELRLEAGRIAVRGASLARLPADETVDCAGCVVLPGLVNGHTHLYSALAVGMPPPSRTPRNFCEILELIWWRLDQALGAESIEMSATIGAIEALRCGTTTLIDHHASPNCIAGSLDGIERGIASVGLRGVLCYETTDRHGHAGRDAGIEENRRYLRNVAAKRDGRFAGLIGAHASFTLDDDALVALTSLAKETQTGVHIHVAEDPCDEDDCHRRTGGPLIDRLGRRGLLEPRSVFGHGTHLDATAVTRVNAAGLTMAHNSRSNMNNAVGYAPVASFSCPVMLGTDGIGADMLAEARSAWLISRHQQAGLSPQRIIAMLAESARRASAALGVTLGKLEAGAAADVVVTDYRPFTPITTGNAVGHLLFGLHSGYVQHVFAGGTWALRDRRVVTCDESAIRARSVEVCRGLWRRLEQIP